jgi:hypothetical protein
MAEVARGMDFVTFHTDSGRPEGLA